MKPTNIRLLLTCLWIFLVCGISVWMRTQTNASIDVKASLSHLKAGEVAQHAQGWTAEDKTTSASADAGDNATTTAQAASLDEQTSGGVAPVDSAVPTYAQSSDAAAAEVVNVPDEPANASGLVSAVAATRPLDDQQWNSSEFELLAAPSYEKADVLATLPVGSVVTPPTPLNMDELLAANQGENPVGYAQPGVGLGKPFKIGTGDPNLAGTAQTIAPDQIQITSTDFLDYDEEHHQVYGQGRLTVRYGVYKLSADRIMVDTRLKEIQAYGNVILSSPQQNIQAESMWFDADNSQGVAYCGHGHEGDFYILSHDPKTVKGTTIRQISKDESVLKDSSFTTCDFPVPHYRLRAKEFTILANERIFAKNVVLYILEKPVLWLPYFTRSLKNDNPWGVTFGTASRLGFYARLFYDFHHECYSPSDVDDTIMVKSDDGRARLSLDYYSQRGFAEGLNYNYYLNNGKQTGQLFAYHLNDSERDVDGSKSSERYYVNWYHRTHINDELDWMVNMDYASDPDIFYDTLDRIRSSSDREQGRLAERRMQTGLEWTTDDFFAGLQVDIKDRIGRDRVSDFGEFRDGDFDFDRAYNNEDSFTLASPGVGPDGFAYPDAGRYLDRSSLDTTLDRGLSSKRYGRVTERMPQLTVSSNRMRLWALPLWYHMDLNMFNNLDKGLNVVSTKDDSFVQGFDLYQSISHLAKFCDRYTLLTKVGLGMGVAQRDDDSYHLNFPDGSTFPFVYDGQVIDGHPLGLTFVDKDTFLVGKRRMSLSDVDPAFVYGDIDSRFNARISDSLTAFIRYRYREGSGNNLGSFYESIGARKSMDDLYAFRTPEHWIEGGLSYQFINPRLALNFNVGKNLQGESQITPGELLQYANLGVSYSNLRNTLMLNSGVGLQERQLRDPTDPFQFQQNSMTYYVGATYMPVHQRYWARLNTYFIQNQDSDPLLTSNDDKRNFDTRDEAVVDATLGKKIGTKYLVELRSRVRSRTTDNQDTYLRVERDFHDVVAGISVGTTSNNKLSDKSEDSTQDKFQIRFNVKFKPSGEKGVTPDVKTSKLFSSGHEASLAREDRLY